jgi:hypothetical protein
VVWLEASLVSVALVCVSLHSESVSEAADAPVVKKWDYAEVGCRWCYSLTANWWEYCEVTPSMAMWTTQLSSILCDRCWIDSVFWDSTLGHFGRLD